MVSPIPQPFHPVANIAAVQRNPAHWPEQVEGFLKVGYGGEKTRLDEERKRDPSGAEHAPPGYCFKLAEAWCAKIDVFISDYFLLPKGSFRDSALDRSAKDLTPKGPTQ
jgi:hypothetical protein